MYYTHHNCLINLVLTICELIYILALNFRTKIKRTIAVRALKNLMILLIEVLIDPNPPLLNMQSILIYNDNLRN